MNAARVLDILGHSTEALGAYDILQRLQAYGRYDPTSVYRALGWLVRTGKVHRLETLKAYVACNPCAGASADPLLETNALFIICDICRSVREIDEPALGRLIGDCATAAMFIPRTGTIEIMGTCVRCSSGQSHAPESSDRQVARDERESTGPS